MGGKRRVTLLMCIFIIVGSVSGCFSKPEHASKNSAIESYLDIPGITQEESTAIEALKASRQSFSFGRLRSTEGFELPDGNYAGFSSFFCGFMSDLFGIPFVLEFYEWDTLTDGINSAAIDFTSEYAVTAERKNTYIMSDPVAQRTLSILTYGSRRIESPGDLEGLKVGILFQESAIIESITKVYPEVTFEMVPIVSASDEAGMLRNGDIDALICSSMRMSYDYSGTDCTVWSDILPLAYIHCALTTTNPELEPVISVLDKYIAAGGMKKLYELYGAGEDEYKRNLLFQSLTDEERAYINSLTAKIPIVMGTDTYPVSFYNEREEEFQGISMDALMLIS
ncbi:MAG: transporter substrate-binding domain-containing protein, partial [Oscillospiraceae bacterium]|nr:transporter substrate-binding domain-containing protein [Oscillospiraceae bacterium]